MDTIAQIGKYIASISFIIGTSITALYLHFDRPNAMEEAGFFYVVIVFIVNSLYFLFLLLAVLIKNNNRVPRIEAGLLMLLNIPVAALYFYIIITQTSNY